MADQTITCRTKRPDNTLMEGTYTARLATGLAKEAGVGLYGYKAEEDTVAGVATLTLPASADLDPPSNYVITFTSAELDQRGNPILKYSTDQFTLDGPKTLDQLLDISDVPLTPSLVTQATEARDDALAAAAEAESDMLATEDHRVAVEAVVATNDGIMAAALADEESASRGVLTTAIDERAASFGSAGSPMLWELRQMLSADLTDVVVANAGDSVSTTIDSWFGLFADALAEEFPAYTFVWRTKTNGVAAYDAPVTTQTGTGTHTVYLYNYAQSGAGTGEGLESNTALEAAFPVAPDFLFISTGHNDDVDGGLASQSRIIRSAVDRLLSYYPNCQVGVVLLNPKTPDQARYTEGLMAHRGLVLAAGTIGLNVIDLAKAFHDRPSGYADLVPDGTHPNTAGQQLLADTLWAAFTASTRATNPNRPRFASESVLVPLMGGAPHTGTPAVAVAASWAAGMGVAFDATVQEAWVTPFVELPYWWNGLMVDVLWTPQEAVTGSARIRIEAVGQQYGANNRSPLSASFLASGTVTAIDAIHGVIYNSTIVDGVPPVQLPPEMKVNNRYPEAGAPLPFQLQVWRDVDHADDTFAGDVIVHAVRLRRFGL